MYQKIRGYYDNKVTIRIKVIVLAHGIGLFSGIISIKLICFYVGMCSQPEQETGLSGQWY
jgi:hypothetical protein